MRKHVIDHVISGVSVPKPAREHETQQAGGALSDASRQASNALEGGTATGSTANGGMASGGMASGGIASGGMATGNFRLDSAAIAGADADQAGRVTIDQQSFGNPPLQVITFTWTAPCLDESSVWLCYGALGGGLRAYRV